MLLTGWSRTERRERKRLQPPPATPDYFVIPSGTAHAVADDDDTALCGARIVHKGEQWPSGAMGGKCRDCMRLAAEQ